MRYVLSGIVSRSLAGRAPTVEKSRLGVNEPASSPGCPARASPPNGTDSLGLGATWVLLATALLCTKTTGVEAKTTSTSMVLDPERMIHPDEARATIFRYLRRLPTERISCVSQRRALRRSSGHRRPATFPAATMDGYAVVADDPSPWREIVGRQSAGHVADLEVSLGTAAWITTGAPVPSGATAVVPVEATEIADEHVIVHQERRIRREYPTHWRRSGKGIGGTDAGKSSAPRRWA